MSVGHTPRRYNELTWRHFEQPLNVGVLRGLGVGSGEAGSPEQGTWVRFCIQIQRGHVTAARFAAFGCPHVIAVASWLTENGVGRPGSTGLPEPIAALQRRFEVPVEKLGRLLVIEDAWNAAIQAAVTKSADTLD